MNPLAHFYCCVSVPLFPILASTQEEENLPNRHTSSNKNATYSIIFSAFMAICVPIKKKVLVGPFKLIYAVRYYINYNNILQKYLLLYAPELFFF